MQYFRLPGTFGPDEAAKFETLNYIAQSHDGYSWGADVARGLIWFDGPQGATAEYHAATERWKLDLTTAGLRDAQLVAVEDSE